MSMLYLVFRVFEWWVLRCAQRPLVAALVLLARVQWGVVAVLQRSPLASFCLPFAAVGALVRCRCCLLLRVAISRVLLLKAVRLRLRPLFYHWDGATMCIPTVAAATSLPSGFGSAAALVG